MTREERALGSLSPELSSVFASSGLGFFGLLCVCVVSMAAADSASEMDRKQGSGGPGSGVAGQAQSWEPSRN